MYLYLFIFGAGNVLAHVIGAYRKFAVSPVYQNRQ
jgi:hypothetical protein